MEFTERYADVLKALHKQKISNSRESILVYIYSYPEGSSLHLLLPKSLTLLEVKERIIEKLESEGVIAQQKVVRQIELAKLLQRYDKFCLLNDFLTSTKQLRALIFLKSCETITVTGLQTHLNV